MLPSISIVVPTRNRPDHAAACAETILRSGEFLELLFVDQSDGPATADALAKFRDPRLRTIRTPTRGVTSGRNLGIESSKGEIVAFTDDDCRVPAGWPSAIAALFAADPEAAIVCGRVVVPEEIWRQGFAETFEPQVREWRGRYPPFGQDWGITANLAVRRAALPAIGLFDPALGAGAPLRSGGEPDFLFRALRAGLKVVNAREIVVEHLGLRRPGAEMQRLFQNYGFGTGAALFKHVRLADTAAVAVYLRFLGACLLRPWSNALRGKRPDGVGYLLAFLHGSLASYKYAVDPDRRMYVPR